MRFQELLGEGFASFSRRSAVARPDRCYPQPAPRKFIGDAQHQRLFRATDRQVDAQPRRGIGQLGQHCRRSPGRTFGDLGDAAVARNTPELASTVPLWQRPSFQTRAVFAAASCHSTRIFMVPNDVFQTIKGSSGGVNRGGAIALWNRCGKRLGRTECGLAGSRDWCFDRRHAFRPALGLRGHSGGAGGSAAIARHHAGAPIFAAQRS